MRSQAVFHDLPHPTASERLSAGVLAGEHRPRKGHSLLSTFIFLRLVFTSLGVHVAFTLTSTALAEHVLNTIAACF